MSVQYELHRLDRSDHVALYCDLSVIAANNRINNTRPGRRIWKYESCDIKKLSEDLLSADWSAITATSDIDTALTYWQSTFMSVVPNHIPSKFKNKLRPKNPFVTAEIEEAIKEKRAALRKLRKNPSATNRNAFKKNKGTWYHTSFARVTTPLHQQATMNPCSTTTKNFWKHMKVVQGKFLI